MTHDEESDPRTQARAAVALINSNISQAQRDALEFEAFMGIFHPKVAADPKRMAALRRARKSS